jgi:hypothetical protein
MTIISRQTVLHPEIHHTHAERSTARP